MNFVQFCRRILQEFCRRTFLRVEKQSEAEAPEDFISSDKLHIIDNVLTKLTTFP